jgi:prepilin-type N-terminal cleavage/methylation domain-containing protein
MNPEPINKEKHHVLQKSMRKQRAGEGGFTLIELLIVIVILGILAAVVVFAVGGITDKGSQSACKSDLKTVETAQEAFYAGAPPLGNGTYAGSVGALVTAKLIRSAPSSSKYTISTDTTGAVTASPACNTLSG